MCVCVCVDVQCITVSISVSTSVNNSHFIGEMAGLLITLVVELFVSELKLSKHINHVLDLPFPGTINTENKTVHSQLRSIKSKQVRSFINRF